LSEIYPDSVAIIIAEMGTGKTLMPELSEAGICLTQVTATSCGGPGSLARGIAAAWS
jgi:hypothetical protein